MRNIVLITADNQPPGLLGCYGNVEVHTPNIDALAARGVLHHEFYSTNGMCSPGRASMLTGLMPSQHGIHSWLRDVDMHKWPEHWSAVEEYESLVTRLKKAGYSTAMVGKHHLGQPREPIPGFDESVTFIGGHTESFYDNVVIDNGIEYEVSDYHIVDFFTNKAVDYIDSVNDSPYFLMVNFDAPYLLPPTNLGPDEKNRFYEMFVGQKFDSFPRTAISDELLKLIKGPDDPNRYSRHMLYDLIRMHNDPESMANVCAQIAIVDDGVGKIMEALARSGHLDETIIVFTADQANLYGQHGLWGHTIQTRPSHLYDAAVRIPFIISAPDLPGGLQVSGPCSQIDLPETLLDLVGIEGKLPHSAGCSFKELLETGIVSSRAVFFEQEESRGVRTPNFSFWTRLPGSGEEVLFDHRIDPDQHFNCVHIPEYSADVSELRGLVNQFFDTYSNEKYDLWRGGQAKGSVSSETFLKPLMPAGWTASVI